MITLACEADHESLIDNIYFYLLTTALNTVIRFRSKKITMRQTADLYSSFFFFFYQNVSQGVIIFKMQKVKKI